MDQLQLLSNQIFGELMAFSANSHRLAITFGTAVVNQQITDVVEYPSDAAENVGAMNANAAMLRGSQAPIYPPVSAA